MRSDCHPSGSLAMQLVQSIDSNRIYEYVCYRQQHSIPFALFDSLIVLYYFGVGLMECDIFMPNLVADNEGVHCTRSGMGDWEVEGVIREEGERNVDSGIKSKTRNLLAKTD